MGEVNRINALARCNSFGTVGTRGTRGTLGTARTAIINGADRMIELCEEVYSIIKQNGSGN